MHTQPTTVIHTFLQLEELISGDNEMVRKAAKTAKHVITWKP